MVSLERTSGKTYTCQNVIKTWEAVKNKMGLVFKMVLQNGHSAMQNDGHVFKGF